MKKLMEEYQQTRLKNSSIHKGAIGTNLDDVAV